MDILSIVFIAIGLAMDCLAVSITAGVQEGKWRNQAILMALLFGLFQGGMPLIGFFCGIGFSDWISRYDHWIALVLLAFIGGKMIVESLQKEDKDSVKPVGKETNIFAFSHLVMLAIATSIDALATGVIFVPTPDIIVLAVSIIAATSLLFSIVGYCIGVYFGKRFHWNMTLIGGIILVAIGLKICIEHLIKGC